MTKSKTMPVIELYMSNLVHLILKCKSGVLYSNQCGGTACDHPRIEGALILPPQSIQEWGFADKVYQRVFAANDYRPKGLTVAAAKEIDKAIEESTNYVCEQVRNIRVDRSLRDCSHEAWVHVTFDFHQNPFGDVPIPLKGVLTWPNSD